MIHRKSLVAAALFFAALGAGAQSAKALQLSFDNTTYVVDNTGTVTVNVYATQSAGGPQVSVGNELLTAGIVLTFNSPAGIATIQLASDITGSPQFDFNSAGVSATAGTLDETSLFGISDLSAPVLLGSFTLTGLANGSTTIQVSSEGPGPSFITALGDVVDPTNVATATVLVPEPATLAILGGVAMMLGLKRRRVAAH